MKRILVVGAGFSGAVIARELADAGHTVLVMEASNHVAGHAYTERDERTGIMLHAHGPHIFNTDDKEIWSYVNGFASFRPFINRVKARNMRGIFSFPINLHTINQFFDKSFGPIGARRFIEGLCVSSPTEPRNFEEKALALVGEELYLWFLKGYTQKQWGRSPSEIPASVLDRLPMRFDYNDNYYSVQYQGIPVDGYTSLVQAILTHENIEVMLDQKCDGLATGAIEFEHVFYSGAIDDFFGAKHGRLSYRTLDFTRVEGLGDLQGNAIINYTDMSEPYTRVFEHKHFAPWESHDRSVAFTEFSREASIGDPLFYPVRLPLDVALFEKYQLEANPVGDRVTFIGRLGLYRYLDMDDVIRLALDTARAYLKANAR
jgi:UDP-galactopyranose mutase